MTRLIKMVPKHAEQLEAVFDNNVEKLIIRNCNCPFYLPTPLFPYSFLEFSFFFSFLFFFFGG